MSDLGRDANPEATSGSGGAARAQWGIGRWLKAVILVVFGVGIVAFTAIQFVPYGRNHDNPPVIGEPKWDTPRTAELVKRSCYDCHSNSTVWPWYSNVAPASWLLQKDVDEGRSQLNFSVPDEWAGSGRQAARRVTTGEMPLPPYLLLHPEANLTPAERQELATGLTNSLAR